MTYEGKVIKIVGVLEVEIWTSQGWTLVETLGNASRPEYANHLEQNAYTAPNGSWIPEKRTTQVIAIVEPKFVLAKDFQIVSNEEGLRNIINDLESRLKASVDQVNQLQTELKGKAVYVTSADKARDAANDAYNTLVKTMGGMRQHAAEQERLVAIARKELGEARWRDIDGTAVTCLHCISEGR